MNNEQVVKNWAKTQQCTPLQIFEPERYEELVHIIQQAREQNVRVHACGAYHSWSNIVCTDGYLIRTTKLNRILSIDHAKCQVRVEGGILIKDLNEQLTEAGLALPNQSYSVEQSMAGAIATATHGTGQTGTLSSFVIRIELIIADGTTRTLSERKNPELFAAARVNIGLLGVVYAVTLQCEPLFSVLHERTLSDMKTILSNYQQLYQQHDFFMFKWNPYTDRVLLYTWDRDGEVEEEHAWLTNLREQLVASWWPLAVIAKIMRFFPRIAPRMIDFYLWGLAKKPHSDYAYKLLPPGEHALYIEAEIAVPMKHLAHAAADVQALIKKHHELDPTIYYMVMFRFVKAETQVYLSPAVDRYSVYISIVTRTLHGDDLFFREFEEAMYAYAGRPHWGKINFLTQSKIKELYGNHARKFIGIRRSLDPKGMFLNETTEKLFK